MTDAEWEALVRRWGVQRFPCHQCHSPRGMVCITRTGRPAERLHANRRHKAALYVLEVTGKETRRG